MRLYFRVWGTSKPYGSKILELSLKVGTENISTLALDFFRVGTKKMFLTSLLLTVPLRLMDALPPVE